MEGGPGKIFGLRQGGRVFFCLRQGGAGFYFRRRNVEISGPPCRKFWTFPYYQAKWWVTTWNYWVPFMGFLLTFRGEKITKSACFRTSFVLGIWLCIITCCILFYRVLSFSLNCMKIPAWPLKPRFEDGEFALWKLFLILWLLRLRPVLKIKNPRQSFVLYDIYCFSISFLWCY